MIDDVSVVRVLREDECSSVPVPADAQERVAFASEADGRIVIDGKLDEPAWSRAVPWAGFRPFQNQLALAAMSPKFRALFDADNLYFGIEIPLNDCALALRELQSRPLLDGAGKPLAKADTYTNRESVDLFVQPPGQSQYWQFAASLDGYRYDGAGMDGAWNGTWESAVSAAGDRWFLEVRIPSKDMRVERLKPGGEWHINICSNSRNGISTWTAVGQAFHNPGGFGKLIIDDYAKWRQERPQRLLEARSRILKQAERAGMALQRTSFGH